MSTRVHPTPLGRGLFPGAAGDPAPTFLSILRWDGRGCTEAHSIDFPCPGQPCSKLGSMGLQLGPLRGRGRCSLKVTGLLK